MALSPLAMWSAYTNQTYSHNSINPPVHVDVGGQSIPLDVIPKSKSLQEIIQLKKTQQTQLEDDSPFYVVDIGRPIHLYHQWVSVLPNVTPFYAMKCNSDPVLLSVLAELGTGFDCASKNEMKDILSLGVSPDRIVFANPCKLTSHLKFAASSGVKKMTVDCEVELLKVKEHFPNAELILRINADNKNDGHNLGVKFGCTVDEGMRLLNITKRLELNVIGVSFHVGADPARFGCRDPTPFLSTIKMSAELFEYASSIGYEFTLLDIGGGFPGLGEEEAVFCHLANTISDSLRKFSAIYPNAKIIAEPGQYFACSTYTLALIVHTKKVNPDGSRAYFTSDGAYGSFKVMTSWTKSFNVNILKEVDPSDELHHSDVWGPLLAPDKICRTLLPVLEVGDWIYFKNMGAYTICCFASFNGFTQPNTYYFIHV